MSDITAKKKVNISELPQDSFMEEGENKSENNKPTSDTAEEEIVF